MRGITSVLSLLSSPLLSPSMLFDDLSRSDLVPLSN